MPFDEKVKIVGQRKTNAYKFQDYDRFLDLLKKLGETTFIIQKGVHKFKTFEEANAWMEEAIVRTIIHKNRQRHRRSKT